MLHSKSHCNRFTGSAEEDFFLNIFAICSPGSHLCHVTWTFYTNFPLSKDVPYEVGLSLAQCFQGRCFYIVNDENDDDYRASIQKAHFSIQAQVS